ncbi:MAG: esterase-like activity of phytase family protein [Burkholderiaceae bacterium]|nr:esterase-like activity of phytase family protein [Burkholderiaceae bacterium]
MTPFPLRRTASALAVSLLLTLAACGGGDDDDKDSGAQPSVPDATMHFNRVSTFTICAQVGSSCESDTPVNAEIVAASSDGMTLIYTSGLSKQIGFVDITDPSAPVGLGSLTLDGEPTSVAVVGAHALVAVNTSPSFVAPAGKLVVVNIASRSVVAELDLGGQPDSVAVSKDGRYAAIAIENERDEDVNDGAIPQLPAGRLAIVDLVGAPTAWTRRDVDLGGLATLYGSDPEPEYVSINEDNIAVVTLQENNHIALIDLATGAVTGHFSAGSVTLEGVDLTDERPNLIQFTQTQTDRLREPDGVTWISKTQFATANEGDLAGGSRGFTVFDRSGSVAWDSGMDLEYRLARIGHTNDRRNDAKGNEPENVAFGRFGSTDYLFVASERSSVVAVYDMSRPTAPAYKQALPGALSPEGLLTLPSRGLMVSASEVDDRGLPARAALNLYRYEKAAPAYPTIESADRSDGKPIPWGALSGLVAAPSGNTVYAVDDSFYRANRIFTVDVGVTPAVIRSELRITDANDVLKNFGATLPAARDPQAFDQTDVAAMINADRTVNLDPEGISLASAGGFWIASEGAGSKTAYETGRNISSANLLLRVSATGVIEEVIALPDAVNALQTRYGFEGVAESDGKLVVAMQRPWLGETMPRIAVYDLTARTWQFHFYPLDPATSPNGGWVGLSEITALGSNRFLVVERDNQNGPDARIKRLYRIDLSGAADGATLRKTLVRDLMPDLRATRGPVLEKIEGLAVLASGEALFVTDNDGVNDSSGETQLVRLGRILN